MAFTKVVGAGIHTLSNIASHNINSSGIITATKFVGPMEGDITAVDGTFTGNVTIGGTLTYEDVKNVDSVGIITARQGIRVPDGGDSSNRISVGDSEDLKIYHTGNTSTIKHNNGSGDLIIDSLATGSDIRLRSEAEFNVSVGGNTHIQVYKNGGVSFNQAGTGAGKKLETMSSGARVTGTLDVTSGITLDDSITHSGDTNTKIRFPSNDTISFETGGTERVSISGAGVSITAGNPALRLHGTSSSFGDTAKIIASRNNDGSLVTGSIVFDPVNAAGADIIFNTRDSNTVGERVRIKNDGKVGIGTNNPGKLLEIFGTDPTIKLRDSSGDAYALIEGDSADQGSLRFRADPLGAGSGTHIRFDTDGTERLRIKSNGDVAINGTATTDAKLDVRTDSDPTTGVVVLAKNNTAYGNGTFYMCDLSNKGNWSFGMPDNTNAFAIVKGIGNSGTEYLRIKSNGYMGVGTNDPSSPFTVSDGDQGFEVHPNSSSTVRLLAFDRTNSVRKNLRIDALAYEIQCNNGTEKLRIDSAGRVLIGHTATTNVDVHHGALQVNGDDYNESTISIISNSSNSNGAYLFFAKQRSGSAGGTTIVQDGDTLGQIRFLGMDGTDYHNPAATIEVNCDGTPSSNDIPGRIKFSTGDNGSLTERFRITSTGRVIIGNSTGTQPSATVAGAQFYGGSYPGDFRISSGAGASGTTTASIAIMGSNHNASIENGANSGAHLNLYNYNTTDGNSSGVMFMNSNGLSASRILGLNVSHSSRTGALVFMTSNGSHPTEKVRITSSGNVKLLDNAKIELGGAQTGSGDLQIFHQTSGSVNQIQSTAGNSLRVRQLGNGGSLYLAGTNIYFQNHDNNQTYLQAQNNGQVILNHSGNARAYTAADGFALSRVNTFPNPNNTGSEITGAMLDIGGNLHLEERYPAGAYSDRQDLVFRFNTGYGQGFEDKFRFTSGSQLLIGATTNRTINSHYPRLQVQGTNYSGATVSIINNANDNNGSYLFFAKQRSGSYGGSTIVQNNDLIGQIRFSGADGTDLENPMAYIECRVDGTPGSNDVPGRLSFYTTPDNTGSPVERLRITQLGDIYAGNADTGGYAFFDNSTLRPRYQFRQGTGTYRGFAIIETRGDANGQDVFIAKSREGNGTGLINAGDQLGKINFAGADGNNMINGAQIFAYTQSTKTVATDRMPTNLSFRTHDDNTAGLVERIRIFHDGRVSMSKNGWAGSDSSFALTVHTGSTSDGGNAVNDGIMIVSQNNNGNQNSTTGKIMWCGHAQTNGPFIYAKNAQAYGKKDLVFHTRSTANDYTTQVAETFRINYQGNVGINEPAPDSQLVVRATTDDNPGIKLYRQSGGGDTASIAWASSVGTNAQINYRGGSGDEGLQFRTSIGNGNQGTMKERFRVNHGNTQGVKIFVQNDSDNAPVSDVTALTIQNGAYGGDIGSDSMPTHIDWQWRDNNSNVVPQCRISGNVGDGGDPNSHVKEGKGFLTFHCSDTGATSGEFDPPQRLRIAHNGTFTGSSSNNISDQRLKENIATITDPIAKIKALKGRTFTWKSEASMREGTHYGFIAQEVETVIPDLIVEDTGIRLFDKDDNLLPSNVITPPVGGKYAKSVDADGVTPVLVEALKEALARIETLEAEVSALKGS